MKAVIALLLFTLIYIPSQAMAGEPYVGGYSEQGVDGNGYHVKETYNGNATTVEVQPVNSGNTNQGLPAEAAGQTGAEGQSVDPNAGSGAGAGSAGTARGATGAGTGSGYGRYLDCRAAKEEADNFCAPFSPYNLQGQMAISQVGGALSANSDPLSQCKALKMQAMAGAGLTAGLVGGCLFVRNKCMSACECKPTTDPVYCEDMQRLRKQCDSMTKQMVVAGALGLGQSGLMAYNAAQCEKALKQANESPTPSDPGPSATPDFCQGPYAADIFGCPMYCQKHVNDPSCNLSNNTTTTGGTTGPTTGSDSFPSIDMPTSPNGGNGLDMEADATDDGGPKGTGGGTGTPLQYGSNEGSGGGGGTGGMGAYPGGPSGGGAKGKGNPFDKDIDKGFRSGGGGYGVASVPTSGGGGGGFGAGAGGKDDKLDLSKYLPKEDRAPSSDELKDQGIAGISDLSNWERVSRKMTQKRGVLLPGQANLK